jgi:hypothetical protein
MGVSETVFRIPLPPRRAQSRTSGEAGPAGRLVRDFLSATDALSCEATAELAGVRTETIRKWRCRVPRALRAVTSRRISAHLTGTPLPATDEGFRRSFGRVLRSVPRPEHGPRVPFDTQVPGETAAHASRAAVAHAACRLVLPPHERRQSPAPQ